MSSFDEVFEKLSDLLKSYGVDPVHAGSSEWTHLYQNFVRGMDVLDLYSLLRRCRIEAFIVKIINEHPEAFLSEIQSIVNELYRHNITVADVMREWRSRNEERRKKKNKSEEELKKSLENNQGPTGLVASS